MALSSPFSNDEIIFTYTRSDAIRDGVLIELPGDLIAEVGISVLVQ
jgi:type I site-specific restriction endonuclease